jgi:CheY-like chemotaxis protein
MVSALIRAVLPRTRERLLHSNIDTQDPAARSPGQVPFERYLPPEARVLRPRAHDRTTSNGPIHLPLIDGHIVFRELLALRLAQEPDFLVIAEAGSLAEIRQVLSRVEVDVALVELALADGGGVELIRDLRTHNPEARVLVLTASEDRHAHAAAFAAGASGVLRKTCRATDIIDAIRQVCAGDALLSSHEAAGSPLPAAGPCAGRPLRPS